jgi:hypothetical protein
MHREAHCLPENQDAFPRYVTRRIFLVTRRDCSLRPSRRLSRSRRPHFVPKLGTVFFDWALQVHGAVTCVVREGSRVQTPFQLVGDFVPGTDDPSTPSSSTDSAVDKDSLPCSHRCQSQCLNGFYNREPAARCASVMLYNFSPALQDWDPALTTPPMHRSANR